MASEPPAGDALSATMRTLAEGADAELAELWSERVAEHFRDTYAGIGITKFPEDLRTYERIMWERPPAVVIEVGVQFGGSTLWLHDRLLDLQRYGRGGPPRILAVDIDLAPARQTFATFPDEVVAGVELFEGDIADAAVADQVRSRVTPGSEVFVIEDAQHDGATTLAALEALAPLVRPGGYYMVEDTCVDYDELRADEDWPRGCAIALEGWLRDDPLGRRFVRRPDLQPYGLTCHPGGLLQRSVDS